MPYIKEISDIERIIIMQKKLEIALEDYKKQYNQDVEVLIYVHPLRYELYCKANKHHKQVIKIIPDIPTLIFCELSTEPVPKEVKEYFRQFYNEKLRIISSTKERINRMSEVLFEMSIRNPMLAEWLIKFKNWYEENYIPTNMGYGEVVIIPYV